MSTEIEVNNCIMSPEKMIFSVSFMLQNDDNNLALQATSSSKVKADFVVDCFASFLFFIGVYLLMFGM